MTWILLIMLIGLSLPLWYALRSDTLWDKMLAFASVSAKSGVFVLAVAVARDDAFTGFVGVIVLSMGDTGLMLLAHLFKRLEVECD